MQESLDDILNKYRQNEDKDKTDAVKEVKRVERAQLKPKQNTDVIRPVIIKEVIEKKPKEVKEDKRVERAQLKPKQPSQKEIKRQQELEKYLQEQEEEDERQQLLQQVQQFQQPRRQQVQIPQKQIIKQIEQQVITNQPSIIQRPQYVQRILDRWK